MTAAVWGQATTTWYVGVGGTDASGKGTTTGDPFATIQYAINQASAGNVIEVAAGTYAGNNIINKSLTILGDPGTTLPGPGSNAPVIDGGSAPGDAFKILNGVSNVTIKGFEIRNFTSNANGIGNGISAWVASTSNINIEDNYFHSLGWNGVMVGNDGAIGSHTNWVIKNNILETFYAYGFELTNTSNSSVENNIIHSDATSNPWTCIMILGHLSQSGISVTSNLIDGPFTGKGVGFPVIYVSALTGVNLDGITIQQNGIDVTGTAQSITLIKDGTGSITNVAINYNRLSRLRLVKMYNLIDATNNYWGNANGPINSSVNTYNRGQQAGYITTDSWNPTISPWWKDISGTPGSFAGTSFSPITNDQGKKFARLGGTDGAVEGTAANGTLYVEAGTYGESVTIPTGKPLTIEGQNGTAYIGYASNAQGIKLYSPLTISDFSAYSTATNIEIYNGGLIQNGVDFALPGGTVKADARTWTEDVTVPAGKPLTLRNRTGTSHARIASGNKLTLSSPVTLTYFSALNAGTLTQINNGGVIQNGIDFAAAGGTVEVAAGTYEEDVTINKSVTIIGAGTANTIVQPTVSANPAFTVSANNVTLKDLKITHPTILTYGIRILGATTGLTIQDVDIANIGGATATANGHGIYIDNSFSELTVQGCNFISGYQGVSSRGIAIFAPNGLTLEDFEVSNCSFEYIWTSIYLRSSIDGFLIDNNNFSRTEIEDRTACVAGVYFGDGDDNNFDIKNINVTNNQFTDYGRGVYVWNYGANSTVSNFNISGNTFTNSIWSSAIRFIFGLNGVENYYVDGISVNNNAFIQSADVGGTGVALVDFRTNDAKLLSCNITVTNNQITLSGAPYNFAMHGIQFLIKGDGFYNTTVSGNSVNGGSTSGPGNVPSTGLYILHHGNNNSWTHNLNLNVTDNQITGFDHAVSIYDAVNSVYGGLPIGTDVNINENDLSGNTIKGIASGTGETINATHNWWGVSPPVANTHFTGDVQYIPYYCDATMTTLCAPGAVVNLTTGTVYTTLNDAVTNANTGETIFINGAVQGGTINASGKTIYITGVFGQSELTGASPALTVTSGDVVAIDMTFSTTTDDHTIVVEGGSLKLRNCVVNATTWEDTNNDVNPNGKAALYYTGGTVDAGTLTDFGGNIFIVNTLADAGHPAIHHAGGTGFETTLIQARGNDWGSHSGPLVTGTTSNDNAGTGAAITGIGSNPTQAEYVNYDPWGGPVSTIKMVTVCAEATEVDVDIDVTGFNSVGTISLTLEYNPSILDVPTVTSYMSFHTDVNWNFEFNATAGVIKISAENQNAALTFGNDTLLTLTFPILDNNFYSTAIVFNDDVPENCEYAGSQGTPIYTDKPFSRYYIAGGVVMNKLSTDNTITADQTICAQTDVDPITGNEAKAEHPGTDPDGVISYQWEESPNGTGSWTAITTDGTAKNYNPPATLMDDTWYRRAVTTTLNGEACTYYSEPVKITVNQRIPIEGTFYYHNMYGDIALNDQVEVQLYDVADESVIATKNTLANGTYSFPVVVSDNDYCPNKVYEIRAIDNGLPYGGINTTDAAQVNAWHATTPTLLGIETVRWLSGDVNIDNSISGVDASRIQQYFVFGTQEPFDRVGWTFWKKGEITTNNGEPATAYPTITLAVNNDASNTRVVDMYGMCMGDFNRSFNPSGAKSSMNVELVYGGSLVAGPEQQIEIPVRMVEASQVGAVSLILDVPAKFFEVEDVELFAGGQLDWHVTGNELRIGWHSAMAMNLAAGDELLTLKLRTTPAFTNGATANIGLVANELNELADELYTVITNAQLSILQIDATIGINNGEGISELALGSRPNPFNSHTHLTYGLPSQGHVSMEVFNMLGMRVATLVDAHQGAGYHTVTLPGDNLKQGAYVVVLTLTTTEGQLVKTTRLIRN
jgi:hypothetical protein